MADTTPVEDTMSEGVSENAVPEKQETREEMLSRHRWMYTQSHTLMDASSYLNGLF